MDAAASLHRAVRHPGQMLASSTPWRAQLHLVGTVLVAVFSAAATLATLLLLPFISVPVAALERRRLQFLTGEHLDSGHLPARGKSFAQYLLLRLGEALTWRETAHLIIGVMIGMALAVLGAIEIVFIGTLFGAPFVAIDRPVHAGRFTMSTPLETWPVTLAGVACLIVFFYANTLIALGHGCLTHVLLSPNEEELAQRLEALDHSRAVILESFDAERRRIERDLHDGVQQRLVDSALTLGLIQHHPNSAQLPDLVQRAIDQNQAALAALRGTILGILPPVLSDHGLIPALRDLADGSSLNVVVKVDKTASAPSGSDTRSELAAYYIVSEALTNVAKHSGTTTATVSVSSDERWICIEVTDNGSGGADADTGTGLAGLRERASAIGGQLYIASDTKGTTVIATLPRASIEDPVSDPTRDGELG